MWSRAGYHRNARVAVIRGHTITSQARGRIGQYDATRNWLLLSSSHLTHDRVADYLEALERFKPQFIHAYPSAALQLAEYLERQQQSLRQPFGGSCNGLAARSIERNHVATCAPSSPRQWGGIERRLEIVQPERFF